MPKLAIRRSCWHWYYLKSVGMLNYIHLSCQDYWSPGEKKHLMSMKNTLFTRRALESECRCSRRHLEEYNQHGVWCWWRQSWFRGSRFVSMFFQSFWKLVRKCTKFLRLCNIVKSRLVSRLRFFFLHLMMTPNDDNFFIRAKCLECQSNRSILFSPLTLEFVFPMKIHLFSVSFLWSEVLLVNRKAKENPLYFWRWLFSGISNAATAEFSSCFCILDEA